VPWSGLLATTSELGAGKHAIAGLRLVAAFLMIALGLYLAGWWHGVLLLERIGARLWPSPQAAGGQVHPLHLGLAGTAVWHGVGLAPCGLVYSMLTWSAAAGSAGGGALIMLFSASAPCRPCLRWGAGGSIALLADPAQFAPWGRLAAYRLRDPHPLDRDCVLLKPYPKRMS
jgi:hypothetical protein